jgi:hypothetical protein
MTVHYKQTRNPYAVTYVKTDKAPSLKITYNGTENAPEWIQVAITYKIDGIEGSYTFPSAFAFQNGAYTLDSGLEGFLTQLLSDETDMLPKHFHPVRPLSVHHTAVTIIPSKLTIDATGKVSTVATGYPAGLATSNRLKIVFKQVLAHGGHFSSGGPKRVAASEKASPAEAGKTAQVPPPKAVVETASTNATTAPGRATPAAADKAPPGAAGAEATARLDEARPHDEAPNPTQQAGVALQDSDLEVVSDE